ncbi:MAG: type II toxin-antitoxin system PemK/MazF family toxin [Cyclobacteriaceae bacterium]
MARFVAGELVVVPFPFSDLSNSKRRPALVLASLTGNDVILCQITSQMIKDNYAVSVDSADLSEGELKVSSNIRPNRIFTADSGIILYKLGVVSATKMNDVRRAVIEILT